MAFVHIFVPQGPQTTTALVARTIFMVKAQAAMVGAAALAGATTLQLKARATFSGKAALAGRTMIALFARDSFSGMLKTLAGRTAFHVHAQAVASTSAFVQLFARTMFMVSAFGTTTRAVALSAKVELQTKIAIGPSLRIVGLQAKTFLAVHAKATITTGAATFTRIWAYVFND